jgi:16S rRNA (guanine527-N7)-methyltransferase
MLRRQGAEILDRHLTHGEEAQFGKYLDLLSSWQRTTRLVGNSDPVWMVEHLILDSLLFLKVMPPAARAIIDVGSGAGFPGIPLRIVWGDLAVTLLESRRRRASFLSTVVRDLAIGNVRVINARLDDALAGLVSSFDAAVMRCAGRWTREGPGVLGLLRPGGVMIASGPPSPDPTWAVDWVRVRGVGGRTRLFAVSRSQAQ